VVVAEADMHGELGVYAFAGGVENRRQFSSVLVNIAERRFIDLNKPGTRRCQRLELFVDDADEIPGKLLLVAHLGMASYDRSGKNR
jgi:hypothetical protein